MKTIPMPLDLLESTASALDWLINEVRIKAEDEGITDRPTFQALVADHERTLESIRRLLYLPRPLPARDRNRARQNALHQQYSIEMMSAPRLISFNSWLENQKDTTP